jgi:hypothetical protein
MTLLQWRGHDLIKKHIKCSDAKNNELKCGLELFAS